MPQVLYRKWRPQTWESVIGQDHVVGTLRNALVAGRVSHAYLFAGPRGTGKTTAARLLAKSVNCLEQDLEQRPCGKCEHCQAVNQGRFLDLIEIDAASTNSVDDVRDLREKINFSPNQGRYKVYIIDEVHMLSTSAFNALLKTLEEPPSHAIFVLATTEVHKIPATVTSRCQRHEFRRIPVADLVRGLELVVEGEQLQIDTQALTLVARQATGSMRDAISLLDQLASSGEAITLEIAQTVLGTAASQSVIELVEALIEQHTAQGFELIHRTLDGGSDPRQFARQVVDYLRGLLIIQMQNAEMIDASADVRAQMARHAQMFDVPELLGVIQNFNRAAVEARAIWQPALPLEIAFAESLKGGKPGTTPADKGKDARTADQAEYAAASPSGTHRVSEPPPAPQDGEDEPTPEDIQATSSLSKTWPRILELVRSKNPQANALLNSTKSHYIRGEVLLLFFSSDLLKGKMERDENLEAVYFALNKVLDRQLRIQCKVDAAARNEVPPGVDDEGIVAATLRDLGGEIVDIQ